MLVEVLLDTPIHVHYGFFALRTAEDADDSEAFRGQVNGLCGAAVPGLLQMRSGLHTGNIQVRIELHTQEPDLLEGWPDVVDTVFAQPAGDTWLTAFDTSEGPVDLPVGIYRVRYSAQGMQRGHELDTNVDDEPVDRYLLQFWPAQDLDRVVRQGSEAAAYWHRDGREPAWTSSELSTRVAASRTDQSARQADELEQDIQETWNGSPPDDPRIRDAGWGAAQLWESDPALVTALADADDPLRRQVTAWAAERVLREAGLHGRSWARPVLDALRDGTEVPNRFDIARDLPAMPIAPGMDPGAEAQHFAVETISNAGVGDNTLANACDVLVAAAHDDDPADVVTLLRAAFPQLA